MARALGGDHDHVDVLRRHDVLEVDVEAVAEAQRLAGLEVRGDLRLVDLPLHLVGQGDDNQRRPVHRGLDIARLEAVLGRQLEVLRPRQLRHDDLDAAVAQVLAVGVSLAAVPDDRHLLALQRRDRGILLVINLCCHHSPFNQR